MQWYLPRSRKFEGILAKQKLSQILTVTFWTPIRWSPRPHAWMSQRRWSFYLIEIEALFYPACALPTPASKNGNQNQSQAFLQLVCWNINEFLVCLHWFSLVADTSGKITRKLGKQFYILIFQKCFVVSNCEDKEARAGYHNSPSGENINIRNHKNVFTRQSPLQARRNLRFS